MQTADADQCVEEFLGGPRVCSAALKLAEGIVKDNRDVHDLLDMIRVAAGPSLMVMARASRLSEELIMRSEELLEGRPIRLIDRLKQLLKRVIRRLHPSSPPGSD